MLAHFLMGLAYFVMIAIIVFYVLSCVFISGRFEKRMTVQENDLVTKHYEEIQNVYQTMRAWRHDYKNHIQVMRAFLELGNIEELSDYLDELANDLETIDTFVKTGNVVVDAVISSKLAMCKTKNIPCDSTIQMPDNCNINDVDLCIIISNLLDNAIEACEKIEEKEDRFVRLYIGTFKEQFYINVTNAMNGPSVKKGNKFVTSKGENHGFGLGRIDKTVNKYSGYVNRQEDVDVFSTEIMIPLVSEY